MGKTFAARIPVAAAALDPNVSIIVANLKGDNAWKPFQGVAHWYRSGVRTAVISNSNGSVRAILERLGLLPSLEFVLDSSAIGVEKPDPRIFRMALERSGLAPDEAVYIGDIYSIDVVGARAAGMQANTIVGTRTASAFNRGLRLRHS